MIRYKGLIAITAGLLLCLAFVNTATAASPGWCTSAKLSQVEKIICDDTSLSAADLLVGQLYKDVMEFRGREGHEGHWPGEIISNQRDWIKERNALKTKSDILDAYTRQIDALSQALKNRWY